MYIYPHKRNVNAPLKVGVIIKVVVFRTLCCVVARIGLATDCCCWSIRSAPRRERGWMLSETTRSAQKNVFWTVLSSYSSDLDVWRG